MGIEQHGYYPAWVLSRMVQDGKEKRKATLDELDRMAFIVLGRSWVRHARPLKGVYMRMRVNSLEEEVLRACLEAHSPLLCSTIENDDWWP